tara:strand:- start:4275 stop:4787 length:513 start_codon:yes stop_codon:yes gene_type:complete
MGRPNWEKDDPNYKSLGLPANSNVGEDKHYTLAQWKENENFNNYFKFSIVRNPWAATYSFYKYRKKRDNFPHKFNSWVECVNPNLWKGFLSPFKYLKIGNDMPVDHIAKFENLDIEWAYICGRLGIPNQPLPRRNQTGYNDEYRSHYNQKSIEYVYSKLSEEINFFHYEF